MRAPLSQRKVPAKNYKTRLQKACPDGFVLPALRGPLTILQQLDTAASKSSELIKNEVLVEDAKRILEEARQVDLTGLDIRMIERKNA